VSNVNCSAIDAKTMLIAKQNNVNYYQFAEQNDVKQCELLTILSRTIGFLENRENCSLNSLKTYCYKYCLNC
jgi:hypothetical protein